MLALLASARFARLEVDGVSMVPTFAPGDHVLVLRSRDVRVGDVVALEDPQATQRVLVKRVVGIDRSSVRVEGDNAGASRDSRDFGPVPRTAIVGRVVTRYHSPRRYSTPRS
jgi:nickel-type superoxide dismutase maturation protease